jgi:hypothetical protein
MVNEATLQLMRDLVAARNARGAFTFDEEAQFVSLFESLDRWMSEGNSIPKSWRPF